MNHTYEKIDCIEVKNAARTGGSRLKHRDGGGSGRDGDATQHWGAKSTSLMELFVAIGDALKDRSPLSRITTLEIHGVTLSANNLDALGSGLATSISVRKVLLRNVMGLSSEQQHNNNNNDNHNYNNASTNNNGRKSHVLPSPSTKVPEPPNKKSWCAKSGGVRTGKGGNIWRLTKGLAASSVNVLSLVDCGLKPGEDTAAILSLLRTHQRRRDEVSV